jgi:excinuclease ABC subunit B
VRKAVSDILEMIRPDSSTRGPKRRRRRGQRLVDELSDMPREDLHRLIRTMEEEMAEAAGDLRFEYAARLRDEIRELEREVRDIPEGV